MNHFNQTYTIILSETKSINPNSLTIAVDFDGTCVDHAYPEIGSSIGAEPVLKELVERGDRLILWTMRSGKTLDDAVKWFADNGIELFGVNENPEQDWSKSPKAHADMYIDDLALGVPLVRKPGKRPYVDWEKVRKMILG